MPDHIYKFIGDHAYNRGIHDGKRLADPFFVVISFMAGICTGFCCFAMF